MTIHTRSGRIIETLEVGGRSTPYKSSIGHTVIRLAVNGRPCDPWEMPADIFEYEMATRSVDEFWEQLADDAEAVEAAKAHIPR